MEGNRQYIEVCSWSAVILLIIMAVIVCQVLGCQNAPDYEDWQCVNLWAEAAVPEYQRYVYYDKRLGPLNKAVRLGTADRVLEITRDQLRKQETTADLRQEVR